MKRISVILFSLAVLAMLGGWTGMARAQDTTPVNSQMNRQKSISELLSGQGTNMIGEEVNLQDVKVRATTDKHAAWVGPTHKMRILVIMPGDVRPMNPNGKKTEMGENDLVNISGTVERAPSRDDLKHAWGVSDDHVGEVLRAGVVIRASEITVLQHR